MPHHETAVTQKERKDCEATRKIEKLKNIHNTLANFSVTILGSSKLQRYISGPNTRDIDTHIRQQRTRKLGSRAFLFGAIVSQPLGLVGFRIDKNENGLACSPTSRK
jgi:hypothetical protein